MQKNKLENYPDFKNFDSQVLFLQKPLHTTTTMQEVVGSSPSWTIIQGL